MRALIAVTVATGLIFSTSAFAAGGEDLAIAKKCMTCHKVDAKLIGPAYKEVAAKYAGQKDAIANLSEKVIKGGTGVWGQIPMTPNQVTPDEAKTIVTWIMSLK
jgi:cytochrome c